MNTIILPKNKYMQILNTQEKLRSEVARLQKIVSYIAQDEVSSKYLVKLSRIEKGLSADKGVRFKKASEIKKFFHSL